jgi:peptidoglycan/LPS O-acetylase OafA/YrhL
MHWLTAYPFATASTAAFYLLMLGFALPTTKPYLLDLFGHPVPPSQKYLGGFDALRGFAAGLVAFGHCWWATYPIFAKTQFTINFIAYDSKAVPIFAVLSGFLIYRSASSAIKSTEGIRSYMIRRFFRIYPVYLLGVLLCFATGQYIARDGLSASSYFLSDLFMFHVIDWPGGFANPPTWSLYLEVVFYAALPLLLMGFGRKRMVAVCAILIIATIAGDAIPISPDNVSRTFSLWKYFFIGIIASELSPKMKSLPSLAACAIGAPLIYFDFGGPYYDWFANLGIGLKHMDGQTLGLGLGCGLFVAGLPNLPALGKILNIAPLRFIGVISYSVYITHFFYILANFPELKLFTLAGKPVMYAHFQTLPAYPDWFLPFVFFPGVMFWGAVSFLLVERPGMRLGRAVINRSFAKNPLDATDAGMQRH